MQKNEISQKQGKKIENPQNISLRQQKKKNNWNLSYNRHEMKNNPSNLRLKNNFRPIHGIKTPTRNNHSSKNSPQFSQYQSNMIHSNMIHAKNNAAASFIEKT